MCIRDSSKRPDKPGPEPKLHGESWSLWSASADGKSRALRSPNDSDRLLSRFLDRIRLLLGFMEPIDSGRLQLDSAWPQKPPRPSRSHAVSYTHLRAHETPEHLVCRLLLEKKNKNIRQK
eukprot:TRINITY_DN21507_c0_g1_i1.p2 TRINITY_DN21507_c0_g1~~TRINITY_DN21507_c0_g1_i1.p2  ORF type:complete len:120 (+),score=11.33 TRINITY_DN21507_c0_g1_i1:174-533(+)